MLPNQPLHLEDNSSLLTNPRYENQIKSVLENIFKENYGSVPDPSIVCLAHKAFLRGLLIKFGARECKTQRIKIDSLLQQIKALEQSNKLRCKLGELLHRRFDFYVKRLKLTSYSQSNKTGAFLARQNKQGQTHTKIPFLLNSQGERMTKPLNIANTFASFYAKLYNLQESENTTPPCPNKIDAFLSKKVIIFKVSSVYFPF